MVLIKTFISLQPNEKSNKPSMEYFIDHRQAHAYLAANFRLYKSTNGWYNLKCPFCNELVNREKLAINFSSLFMKCWVCEYRGFIIDFIQDYEGVTRRQAVEILRKSKPSLLKIDVDSAKNTVQYDVSDMGLPESYCPIMDGDSILGIRARNYLTERGFDLKLMDRLGIGYGASNESDNEEENYLGYIIIPFKEFGKLKYFIGRDYIGNYLRYKNPPKEQFGVGKGDVIFNSDALILQDEVFITEGWADACTMGVKGTSTQGWSLSNIQKSKYLKSNCKTLVFIPDAGGDDKKVTFFVRAVELAMEFLDYKTVYVLDLNPEAEKDPKKGDVNAIGRQRILEIYEQTKPLTFASGTEILMNYV